MIKQTADTDHPTGTDSRMRADWQHITIAYQARRGTLYKGTIEQFLASDCVLPYKQKVQLIFTSPPFPLNRKKKYGNLTGDDYVKWFSGLAAKLTPLLKRDGSIVVELGNAWEPGKPIMSTLALKALLAFLEAGNLNLCQQFICHNPARLPSPAEWVNVKRIRVKDSYTHVWWMSPSETPKADNRNVLRTYSASMKTLLRTQKYNAGRRPSEHHIGGTSFLHDNGGAIPSNVLAFTNTSSSDDYLQYCREMSLAPHPARMPPGLPEFFIRFLTTPRDLVFDPFAGSNTTGAVAEKLKRRWVSVEPLEEYVQSSKGRFAKMEKGRL